MWNRFQSLRGDRGEGMAGAVAGISVGVVVILITIGLVVMFQGQSQAATDREASQTSINEALHQIKQQVQVADTILVAEPNTLITEGPQGDGAVVRTRWIAVNDALHKQTWTGFSGEYPYSGNAWIAPTTASANAPAGGGEQWTSTPVRNLRMAAGPVFTYFGQDNAPISVVPALTAADGKTSIIKRVAFSMEVKTGEGVLKNASSASPRNVGGQSTDGNVPAPTCPDATLTVGSTPKLTWSTVPGVTQYVIYRNSSAIKTVSVAAGATSGSWEDTTVTAVAGEAVTYSVTAKNSSGESISCRPLIYRPNVSAPALTSTLMPSGTEAAAAWNPSTLTKPEIRFDWNAVPNATGYELFYRELNADTGIPLTPGYTALSQLNADQLTYTWTGATWGSRYEWYIKANSRVGGSPESRHNIILTHPTAPAGLTVTAAYGEDDAADRLTRGRNIIRWNAVPTATAYEVWRYNSGTSGPVTLACKTTGALTCTEKVAYGTEYTYYVVAKNLGPRGYTAAGSQPSTYAPSATPESRAQSKPAKVTQLQYPPVAAMSGLRNSDDGSRDIQGTNIARWKAAASATGYHVYRVNNVTAATTCLTGACTNPTTGGVSATEYRESAPPGSRRGYIVRAYNATGLSIEAAAPDLITQRPAAPQLSVTSRPSLTTDAASFTIAANGDAGNPAGQEFCIASGCNYELQRNGTAVSNQIHPSNGKVVAVTNASNPQGVTVTYRARSKNAAFTGGGWSDFSTTTVNTYPGPFTYSQFYGDRNGKNTARFRLNMINSDYAGSEVRAEQNGMVGARWGASGGARNVKVERIPVANDTVRSNGGSIGLPTQSRPYAVSPHGNANAWEAVAAPGATYRHTITAIGQNGLERSVTTPNIVTPAELPQHGKVIVVCSGNTYSNQESARWDHPGHRVASRLIDFTANPLYGKYESVWVKGITMNRNGSWYVSNEKWYAPRTSGNLNSSAGLGYWYGHHSGFDITTWGSGGPNSLQLRVSLAGYATFNDGCGPAGATYDGLREPTWACYGYVPGQACQTNNPQNRPQWWSR